MNWWFVSVMDKSEYANSIIILFGIVDSKRQTTKGSLHIQA